MKILRLTRALLLSALVFATGACDDDDDDYVYPSVKLEFITVKTNDAGCVATITTDSKRVLAVAQDNSGSNFDANTSVRAVSNYEATANGSAIIYALASVLSPTPLPATDKTFGNGIKTDPLTVQSMWAGYRYINLLLQIKTDGGKQLFHFVEESDTEASDNVRAVKVLLYHDSNNCAQNYTKRVYASIPLEKYIGTSDTIRVTVAYHDADGTRCECDPIDYVEDAQALTE